MSEPQISGGGPSYDPSTLESAFIAGMTAPPSSSQIIPFFTDSISTSSSDSSVTGIDARRPILPKADYYTTFLMKTEKEKNEIINAMLDDWNRQLQEEAQRMKDKLNSPEYYAWQQSQSADAIAEREEKAKLIKQVSSPDSTTFISSLPVSPLINFNNLETAYAWNISLQNGINNVSAGAGGAALSGLGRVTAAEFLAPMMLMGAAAIPIFQGIVPTTNSNQDETVVFKQGWDALNDGKDVASAVGGWFSAMWGMGLMNHMIIDNMKNNAVSERKDKPHDVEFAKNYANKLGASVSDPSFSSTLKAMAAAAATEQGKPLTDQELALLEVKSKIVLLSTALALVGKLEVGSKTNEGWISEMDFAGLLTGKTDIHKDDIFGTGGVKEDLIAQIRDLIRQIPGDKADEVFYNLLTYMSKNPSVEKLLDQQEVLSSVLNPPKDLENEILTNKVG